VSSLVFGPLVSFSYLFSSPPPPPQTINRHLLVDSLLVEDDHIERMLDVPALVAYLRRQRPGMVQTEDQYAFIYRALLDEIRETSAAPRE
jgi:protein tyrosine phosphatase